MSETKDISVEELLKEKCNGVTMNQTFTADSTARKYGYLPLDMGANIRDLEGRIVKLLREFNEATKCNVSSIVIRRYNYVNPKDNTLNVVVNIEK